MKKTSLILCIIACLCYSCKKDNVDNPNDNNDSIPCTTCKLTEITLETTGSGDEMDTLRLQYNSDGKISSILYDGDGTIIFNYQGDSCIETNSNSSITKVYKLNSNNYVTKKYYTDYNANYNYYTDSIVINETRNLTDIHTYKYFLNNNNYISATFSNSGTGDPYYPTFETTEYYLDKENKFPFALIEFYLSDFEDGITESIFTPKNQKLIKTWQHGSRTYNYSYEYNTSGYVTKLTLTEMPANNIQIYHFKYE